MNKKLRNILLLPFFLSYLLFEELIWQGVVVPVHSFFARLRLYESFLAYVEFTATRYTVLVLFVLPFIIGEALGVLSAVLAANTQVLFAILVYLLKIPIVVVAFGILKRGRVKLDSFSWFVVAHQFVASALLRIQNSSVYGMLKVFVLSLKSNIVLIKVRLRRTYKGFRR